MGVGIGRKSPVKGEINAIGIPTTMKIKSTVRYLSTVLIIYKTIYLFDFTQLQ